MIPEFVTNGQRGHERWEVADQDEDNRNLADVVPCHERRLSMIRIRSAVANVDLVIPRSKLKR
jgi:hypothetical protein